MYVMAIYLVLSVYVLFIREKLPEKYKKIDLYICAFLYLFFVIRYNIGRDLVSYNYSFYTFKKQPEILIDIILHRNTLFNLFFFICTKLFDEYRWFMLVVNIINLTLCSITIYRHSKNVILSALIFIGSGVLEVYYASGIRQMMAMSIFFIAFYELLPKKKYLLYELVILIAVLFHETVFFAFFIPLLIKVIPVFKNHPIKTVVLSSAAAGLIAVLLTLVLPRVLNYNIVPWQYYTVISYLINIRPSIMGIGMETVILCGVLFLYLRTKTQRDDFSALQCLTIVMSVVVYYAFSGFSVFSRVADSLQIITILYIPELLLNVCNKDIKIPAVSLVLFFNAFLLFSDLRTNLPAAGQLIGREITFLNDPYITVFNKKWIDESIHPEDWGTFVPINR